MSQSKKRGTDNRSVDKAPDSKTTDRKWSTRQQLITALLVIAAILITVGGFYYFQYVAPMQKVVCVVGDDSARMGYFIKRTRWAQREFGADIEPEFVLRSLIAAELLIKQGAAKLGIEVTDEDIDNALRAEARGESDTISEKEFEEWYRQLLNESKFTDAEFRDISGINLLVVRIQEYLAVAMGTTTEHLHLHATELDADEIQNVWERYQAGEELGDIAGEVWQEQEIAGEIEDIGWLPMGIAFENYGWAVTALDIGEISEPIRTGEEIYSIIMVSEMAFREIDEQYLDDIRMIVFNNWLETERQLSVPQYHGRSNGYDSATDFWVKQKIAEMSEE